MNVLSTFNGMGCIWLALDKLGIEVNKRYSSEIDKYANQVNDKNYPDTIQLGDVTKLKAEDLEPIDLLVGGSPCQGFSFAGKQLNFDDPRSKLFFEFVRLLKECKPKYFLLENVKMKKEYEQVITDALGVEPIEINSNVFTAQNRRRYYWTNIPQVLRLNSECIYLDNILEDVGSVDEKYFVSERQLGRLTFETKEDGGVKGCFSKPIRKTDKSECLMARDYKGIPGKQDFTMAIDGGRLRKLTPVEYERLQDVPDNYTDSASNTQRYKMLGNGWTITVIEHLLYGLKSQRGEGK